MVWDEEQKKDPWGTLFDQAEANEKDAAAPAKDQAPAVDAPAKDQTPATAAPTETPAANSPAPPLNAPPSEAPSNPWENVFKQAEPLEKPRYGTNVKRPDVHSGVADEDLIKSFGYDPKVIYKSPTYQLLKNQFGTGFGFMLAPKTKDDLRGGILRSPLGAAGQGTMDTLLGIAQLGAHAVGEKDDQPYMDLLTKVSDENYRQNIHGGDDPAWYNQFTRTAFPALIPVGGEALEGTKLIPAITRGVATGAAFGMAQPVYTDPNDPKSYGNQKIAQVGFGGAGGGAGATGARVLSGSFGRLASMFKTPLPEDAAADMANTLHGAMNGSWGNLSDLQNVADPRLAARARSASEAIANAGSDPTKIEQAVVKLQNFRTAARANELYDQVGQLARGAQVPVTNTLASMQKLLNELPKSIDENGPLISSIKGWMDNLQPKTVEPEPPPGVMGNIQAYTNWKAANPPVTTPGRNLFSQMQEFSSDLGDMIDSGMSGEHGMIAPQSVRRLQQIKDAVDLDLRTFTQSSSANPALQQASKTADDYYRTHRAPFLDRSVAKAGTTDMPDTLFGMFIRGGDHADLASKFYNILTPKGRSAVQAQMLDKIINESTPSVGKKIVGAAAAEPPLLDARTFLNSLNKYKPALDVFFQGKDQQALQGIEKLMQHYATTTERGRIPMGVMAGLATGLLGHHIGLPYNADIGGGMAIGGAAIKWLMQTDAGRKIAANAFTMKPATPQMAALWGKLLPMVPYISRFGATGTVRATNPTITVKPWQPPAGFAGGGLALEARLRRNTLESLQAPIRRADGGGMDDDDDSMLSKIRGVSQKIDEGKEWLGDRLSDVVFGKKPVDLSRPAYTTPSVVAPGYKPPWGGPLNLGPSTPPAYHPSAADTDDALRQAAEKTGEVGSFLGNIAAGIEERPTEPYEPIDFGVVKTSPDEAMRRLDMRLRGYGHEIKRVGGQLYTKAPSGDWVDITHWQPEPSQDPALLNTDAFMINQRLRQPGELNWEQSDPWKNRPGNEGRMPDYNLGYWRSKQFEPLQPDRPLIVPQLPKPDPKSFLESWFPSQFKDEPSGIASAYPRTRLGGADEKYWYSPEGQEHYIGNHSEGADHAQWMSQHQKASSSQAVRSGWVRVSGSGVQTAPGAPYQALMPAVAKGIENSGDGFARVEMPVDDYWLMGRVGREEMPDFFDGPERFLRRARMRTPNLSNAPAR